MCLWTIQGLVLFLFYVRVKRQTGTGSKNIPVKGLD
jgi:hypothetical protein